MHTNAAAVPIIKILNGKRIATLNHNCRGEYLVSRQPPHLAHHLDVTRMQLSTNMKQLGFVRACLHTLMEYWVDVNRS